MIVGSFGKSMLGFVRAGRPSSKVAAHSYHQWMIVFITPHRLQLLVLSVFQILTLLIGVLYYLIMFQFAFPWWWGVVQVFHSFSIQLLYFLLMSLKWVGTTHFVLTDELGQQSFIKCFFCKYFFQFLVLSSRSFYSHFSQRFFWQVNIH